MISEFRVFSYKQGGLITDGVKVSSCRHVSVARPPSLHAMLWGLHTLYIDVLTYLEIKVRCLGTVDFVFNRNFYEVREGRFLGTTG